MMQLGTFKAIDSFDSIHFSAISANTEGAGYFAQLLGSSLIGSSLMESSGISMVRISKAGEMDWGIWTNVSSSAISLFSPVYRTELPFLFQRPPYIAAPAPVMSEAFFLPVIR